MKGDCIVPDRFNIVKKGYDTTEVDEYIASLEEVVKSYKEKDTAIKNALISAELAADNIILNAKNRSVEMKDNSVRQLKDIAQSISTQKELLSDFQKEYEVFMQKYLQQVVQTDVKAVRDKIDALEVFLQKLAKADEGEKK